MLRTNEDLLTRAVALAASLDALISARAPIVVAV